MTGTIAANEEEPPPQRTEAIAKIARAATRGSLGLFVGAGMAKALTAGTDREAPSWGELLRLVANDLGLSFPTPEDAVGMSFPQIASELVEEILKSSDAADSTERVELVASAVGRLKEAIADRSHFDVPDERSKPYAGALKTISPAWVVTTNYDLLIEELIDDSSVLLPDEVIPHRRDGTPVYHLHGHCLQSSSIVITEEDYVRLFRPAEYRQLKLSLLFSESTTLVLGYRMRDVNTLSAIDWSRRYGSTEVADGAVGTLIQALYKASPAPEPYIGEHGQLVIEFDDMGAFLREVADSVEQVRRSIDAAIEPVRELLKTEGQLLFTADSNKRRKYLEALRTFSESRGNRVVLQLLDRLMEPTRTKSEERGGFPHYATLLNIVLDCFEVWGGAAIHPSMFRFLADQLSRLCHVMGSPPGVRAIGESWDANRVWAKRKPEMSTELLARLLKYAEATSRPGLCRLLVQEAKPVASTLPVVDDEW